MSDQQVVKDLRAQNTALKRRTKELEVWLHISEEKRKQAEDDLQRMKQIKQEDIARLQQLHDAELERVKARHEDILRDTMKRFCSQDSSSNEMASIPPDGDTGSSSDLIDKLQRAEDLDSATDTASMHPSERMFCGKQMLTDPCAKLSRDPGAPDPKFVRDKQMCQTHVQQVLSQPSPATSASSSCNQQNLTEIATGGSSSVLGDQATIVAAPATEYFTITDGDLVAGALPSQRDTAVSYLLTPDTPSVEASHARSALGDSVSTGQNDEVWDQDDELLMQMEAREAQEINADELNDVTFPSADDSEYTDLSRSTAPQQAAVKKQLKAKKMLSKFFEQEFSSLKKAIDHLEHNYDTLNSDGSLEPLKRRFHNNFGLPGEVLMPSLREINVEANHAKHPGKRGARSFRQELPDPAGIFRQPLTDRAYGSSQRSVSASGSSLGRRGPRRSASDNFHLVLSSTSRARNSNFLGQRADDTGSWTKGGWSSKSGSWKPKLTKSVSSSSLP